MYIVKGHLGLTLVPSSPSLPLVGVGRVFAAFFAVRPAVVAQDGRLPYEEGPDSPREAGDVHA